MKLNAFVAALAAALAASTYATDWTYSSTDQTISDGQWTLSVRSLDKSTGTITLGYLLKGNYSKCVTNWSAPEDKTKSGVLDLRRPLNIDDGTDVTEFNIVKFSDSAFSGATDIVEFYCDVVSEMGKSCFNGCTSMTKAELAGSADSLKDGLFRDNTATNVVFDFPNLTNVAGYAFYNRKTLKADVMDILKPGVVAVAGNAFYNCYELTGTLTLTNVQTIGATAFYECKNLSEIYLAGPCADIGSQAFYNCSGLKRATFDLAENATVGFETFGRWNPPEFESIRFLRKPFGAASMTNLLFNATGPYNNRPLTAANACTVYVSKIQWPTEERAACEWWRPATTETLSEEELAAKPKDCLGVAEIVLPNDTAWPDRLRGKTQRAWIVHKASPYDRAGMILVVR